MQDWNVVVTVREHCYRNARRRLEQCGEVSSTDFLNVLLLRVDSTEDFLSQLQAQCAADPEFADCLGHAIPALRTFVFQSAEEFEAGAKKIASGWLAVLGGTTFHVRMHRRGFKGRLSSQGEERFLDHYLLDELRRAGTPGRIGFTDPDVIVAVETVGQWAGLSYWTRTDLQRYPFLGID